MPEREIGWLRERRGESLWSGKVCEEGVRVGVVGRLRARRLEIGVTIFARVLDGVPDPLGGRDVEYLEGLHAAAVAAVDYVLANVERSDGSLEPVPLAVVAQARRAARAGVRLDTVLRRYLAGYVLLEDFVMGEVNHDDLLGRGMAFRRVLRAMASLLDHLITVVSHTYREEIERAGHHTISGQEDDSSARVGADRPGSRTYKRPVGLSGVVMTQRARILRGIVEVVAERGLMGAAVALVTARARVSRRTFYEYFAGLEDGLVAVMDESLEQISVLVSRAFEEGEGSWRDGLRSALAAVLAFFDSELELARVCFVETLAGPPAMVEHRERIVGRFRALIVARIETEDRPVSPLAAEGVVASVMGVIRTRLISREPLPLITLLGPLMGMIVRPFTSDERAVAEEVLRGDDLVRAIQAGESGWASQPVPADTGIAPELPATLGNPRARRARQCLRFVADHPDSSNREVAMGIGVTQKSQISALLSYLLEHDLVAKRSEGSGKRNAWCLTPRGEDTARRLSEQGA